MMTSRVLLTFAVAAALLAGCKEPGGTEPGGPGRRAGPARRESDASTAGTTPRDPDVFDAGRVPVSNVPLLDFPFIQLPAGYPPAGVSVLDYERVPLWTGDQMEWVEGRIHMSRFEMAEGKQFSALELGRNLDHVVAAMGVKVTESPVPQQVVEQIPRVTRDRLEGALLWLEFSTANTDLIRRADRDIWVQLRHSTQFPASWMVVETKALVPTATLLPAAALKQQLDDAGTVPLQVNPATDKAGILPDSQPQLAEVARMLEADPVLRLAVGGHTDDSGDAGHNQRLSERRAQAVVAALAAHGIERSRLSAEGFGATRPVADNGSEDGRARNRRVGLARC